MPTRRHFLAGGSATIVAGAAPRVAWGKTEVDVAIIGAGLAGLNAARICEAAGLSMLLLEGENRVGGRLHTLDDLPGGPDAGGIQVGAGYNRLKSLADDLGVKLSDSAGAGAGRRQTSGNFYSIKGSPATGPSWPASPGNSLPEDERTTSPALLLRKYGRAFPSFECPEEWLNAAPELDFSVAQALNKAGASAEALRLIEANFNGNSLASMSQLHLARTFAIFRSQPGLVSTIVGGSQRLPEAMAGALSGAVRLGQRVRAIREKADSVEIRLGDHTVNARQCLCTIPFSALRTVPLETDLPPSLAHMIAGLPYTRASLLYLSSKTPFWRDDGFPETLWSDDPLIGRVFVIGNSPPMLKLWTTGSGADLLDRMTDEAINARVIPAIEAARPSAKGQLRVLHRYSWQKSPFAGGIYHHIGTGMAKHLAASTRRRGTRLHFAGEHLAQASSGMEAALESGERAALEIAEKA